MEMNIVQRAIYSLVKRFVERQQLVFDIIKELRPYLVNTGTRRPDRVSLRKTTSGYWGIDHEWEYFMHGGGCKLTHTVTHEVIEWDAPDLQRFDPYWFTNWVSWFLGQYPQDSLAQVINSHTSNDPDSLRNFLFDLLGQLKELRQLNYYPDRTNMYELISGE
jgi:hypothetical protein